MRLMKDRSHDDAMVELFSDDPEFAAHYLDEILRDGEPADLLIALRQMAAAVSADQPQGRREY